MDASEIFATLPHPELASNIARQHPAYTAARRSWSAAMARDKPAWLDCFAADALVEDPVGPSVYSPDGSGQRGHAQLSDFFDQSIAVTTSLDFRMVDALCGGNEVVFRGVLRVGLGDTTMDTDIIINYRVDAAGKLTNLRAFWELDRALATVQPTAKEA